MKQNVLVTRAILHSVKAVLKRKDDWKVKKQSVGKSDQLVSQIIENTIRTTQNL